MACLVLQQVCVKIQALRQLPEERKQEFARARQCSDISLLHLVLAKLETKKTGNSLKETHFLHISVPSSSSHIKGMNFRNYRFCCMCF